MTPEQFGRFIREDIARWTGWRANARSNSTPEPMARNTRVDADHDAPPITRTLANFVATHPSRGWSDAVEHEAHRSLLNWMGCAVGAAGHESVHAALAAVQMLQPAPQAQVPGPA
jgi:hypothetical protein